VDAWPSRAHDSEFLSDTGDRQIGLRLLTIVAGEYRCAGKILAYLQVDFDKKLDLCND
jgi:hypothetical protein